MRKFSALLGATALAGASLFMTAPASQAAPTVSVMTAYQTVTNGDYTFTRMCGYDSTGAFVSTQDTAAFTNPAAVDADIKTANKTVSNAALSWQFGGLPSTSANETLSLTSTQNAAGTVTASGKIAAGTTVAKTYSGTASFNACPATYVSPSSPTVVFMEKTVVAGGKLTISMTGFLPFEKVKVWMNSTPILLADGVTMDANGAATITVTIPATAEPGYHTITVERANGTVVGSLNNMTFQVLAAAGDTTTGDTTTGGGYTNGGNPPLANTGVPVVPAALTGFGLIAAGAITWRLRRN